MSYGLVGLGDVIGDRAKGSMRDLAQQEQQRNSMNNQLDQQAKAQKSSTMFTGAGMGMMAGLSSTAMGAKFGMMAGPVGALLGAGVGMLASRLFD